jgi:purine-binding chemotaxis protein CheW
VPEGGAAVVVRAGGATHAIPAEQIVEVLRMVAVTPMADQPSWALGVVNRRGELLPVIDLASRLGLPATEPGLDSRLVVCRAGGRMFGVVVDHADAVVTGHGAPVVRLDLSSIAGDVPVTPEQRL